MKRFWLWWCWRRLVVQTYLAWHTDDSYLALDLENQARRAKHKLDDYDLQQQFRQRGGLFNSD